MIPSPRQTWLGSGFALFTLLSTFDLKLALQLALPPPSSQLRFDSPRFASLPQDEVGTFPNSVAFRIMEEDLGVPPQQIFDFVFPDPVASASIGQVLGNCRGCVSLRGVVENTLFLKENREC